MQKRVEYDDASKGGNTSICRHTVSLACVPQFDTMRPGMSLGANFNDRIWEQ